MKNIYNVDLSTDSISIFNSLVIISVTKLEASVSFFAITDISILSVFMISLVSLYFL